MRNPLFTAGLRSPSGRPAAGWVGLCFVLSALVFVGGCSKKEKLPKDFVGGKVTLEEKPVSGTIVFVYEGNKEVSTPIKTDGSYRMDNPPQGKVKVLVKSMLGGTGGPVAQPPKVSGGPEMPKMNTDQGETPPLKYGSVQTSDLTFEVTGGQQTYDIPLKK